MKRSKNYYLKCIEHAVEKIRSGDSINVSGFSSDTIEGMKLAFTDYLEHTWMILGDTAFNRNNYRASTDYLFEQLRRNS